MSGSAGVATFGARAATAGPNWEGNRQSLKLEDETCVDLILHR